jgi:hypothetical protein
MKSGFYGLLTNVKNRGEPYGWCRIFEREVEDFMNFETRNVGYAGNFLQILEKKL